MLIYTTYTSPLGQIFIYARKQAIVEIALINKSINPAQFLPNHPLLLVAKQEIAEYFTKNRHTFTFPFFLNGSEFQQSVWQALCTIPYGKTATYKEIAQQINKPKAARAVGQACNKNPISIVIPCHRVIGSNQQLVGYASGLKHKKALLEHEKQGNICI